jgi:transcriptional regulator with XRE-family HTH domain
MARKAKHNGWKTPLGRFIAGFGAESLALAIGVAPATVYHWMSGLARPRPEAAAVIQRVAQFRGVTLTLDEIYQVQPGGNRGRKRKDLARKYLRRRGRGTLSA